MLKRLSISQYVIISELHIDFADGLTVLTGETGAGKSILLDALGLILGDDADREAIRQGEDESVIEAIFVPPEEHPVWAFLAQNPAIEQASKNLVVKRTIDRRKKDEILINGAAVELTFLKELSPHLVEIHGQFANQTFLAPEMQLSLLDAFGHYPPEILGNVATAWAEIGRLTQELEDERHFLLTAERERHNIERIVAEIAKIGVKPEEYEGLKARLVDLKNTRSVSETFQAINSQFMAQTGVELSLVCIDRLLEQQKDEELDVMKQSVKTALNSARTAIAELHRLAPVYIDIDTSEIEVIEKKMMVIAELSAEQKVTTDQFFERYIYLSDRLARIRNAPAKIKQLDDQLIKANEVYARHARILSKERRKAAVRLSDAITAEMAPLKLMSAEVEVEVTEDTNKRTVRGFNDVMFTARMNPGMPFSPITKTASGGEMARLILAVKMILQQVQTVSTLVFDEVDTGIGGAAAAAVGSRIARLADSTQILVITHSPQVASRGNQHLHVSKRIEDEKTHTVVSSLSYEQRVNEISRMLAGEEITEESAAAARTLIEEARKSAERRKQKAEAPPVSEELD